jgi:hypothetical protein
VRWSIPTGLMQSCKIVRPSGFDPKQHTGSYNGPFQPSKYEFNKFGSGQILDSRDNAVAAAYKVPTEGILFE